MRKTLNILASVALVAAGLALIGFFGISAVQNFTSGVSEDTAGGLNDVATTIETTEDSAIVGP